MAMVAIVANPRRARLDEAGMDVLERERRLGLLKMENHDMCPTKSAFGISYGPAQHGEKLLLLPHIPNLGHHVRGLPHAAFTEYRSPNEVSLEE